MNESRDAFSSHREHGDETSTTIAAPEDHTSFRLALLVTLLVAGEVTLGLGRAVVFIGAPRAP